MEKSVVFRSGQMKKQEIEKSQNTKNGTGSLLFGLAILARKVYEEKKR